jgi:hypothetical protein
MHFDVCPMDLLIESLVGLQVVSALSLSRVVVVCVFQINISFENEAGYWDTDWHQKGDPR